MLNQSLGARQQHHLTRAAPQARGALGRDKRLAGIEGTWHPRVRAALGLCSLVVIVELAFWLAVSVLVCDNLLVRPALFSWHLGRELLSLGPGSAGRPSAREVLGRVLRRTAVGYVAVTVGAFVVVAVVLVAGQWSGLVLIPAAVWGVRLWRRSRRDQP